jgi:hypothetical protein
MVIQKISESKLPSDTKFLEDITKINIIFDENSYLKQIPFCYKYSNFINPTKKIQMKNILFLHVN